MSARGARSSFVGFVGHWITRGYWITRLVKYSSSMPGSTPFFSRISFARTEQLVAQLLLAGLRAEDLELVAREHEQHGVANRRRVLLDGRDRLLVARHRLQRELQVARRRLLVEAHDERRIERGVEGRRERLFFVGLLFLGLFLGASSSSAAFLASRLGMRRDRRCMPLMSGTATCAPTSATNNATRADDHELHLARGSSAGDRGRRAFSSFNWHCRAPAESGLGGPNSKIHATGPRATYIAVETMS